MSTDNLVEQITALLEAKYPDPCVEVGGLVELDRAKREARDAVRDGIVEYFYEILGNHEDILIGLLDHLDMSLPLKRFRVHVDFQYSTLEVEGIEAKSVDDACAKVLDALEWQSDDEVEVEWGLSLQGKHASADFSFSLSETFDLSDADVEAEEME
jgi:hypothetical protein